MDIIETSQHSLEWHNFLQHYSSFCYSSPAQERAMKIQPPDQQEVSELLLRLTVEAIGILPVQNFSEIGDLPNLEKAFQRLAKSACLSGAELYAYSVLIDQSQAIREFFRDKSHTQKFSEWGHIAAQLNNHSELRAQILRAILPDGSVKDSASSRLEKLRREERRIHEDAKRETERMLKQAHKDGYAQDTFFDFRDGRYVLPVKREYKNQISGIVYESSASKATVYVEPASLRGTNDRIRQIQIDIEEEIYTILRTLTDALYPKSSELWEDYQTIVDFDLCLGRARIANDFDEYLHSAPYAISSTFNLQQFYHPLLRKVLPATDLVTSDFVLDSKNKIIIISGPNTGGKTVLLKAIGLAALMVQGGFCLTATPTPQIPYFKKILAHIGDEQSIEKSLSSFSSSILIIKRIIDEADASTLVLIDEILSSTDPREASALSKAILKELAKKNSICVVTTHFSDLKELSSENENFLNASMEFDTQELKPMYRLKLGIPGKSWAIETAARLGLPQEIINEACQNIGTNQIRIDNLIAQIERQEGAIHLEREFLAKEREQLQTELQKLKGARQELINEKRSLRDQFQIEFQKVEKRALEEVEKVIDEYKNKIQRLPDAPSEAIEAKKKIVALQKQLDNEVFHMPVTSIAIEEAPPPIEKLALAQGSLVQIKHLNMKGTLLSNPQDMSKQAEIQIGNMKIRADWKQIIVLDAPAKQAQKASFNITAREDCPQELNLLGLRVDDAISRLEEFLDKASQSTLPSVRIVHGHGTGALKKAVRDLLRSSAYDFKFRPGKKEEGGDGCTVIDLIDV